MGGLAGMVAQGAAWGTGTHRPRCGRIHDGRRRRPRGCTPRGGAPPAPLSNPCVNRMKLFSDCIKELWGDRQVPDLPGHGAGVQEGEPA